jgi:uncharacterized protein YuzE
MAGAETMTGKHLNGKGEVDYDYVNDILFFKVKDREYDFSVEFPGMVMDVDSEQFITGIQIFNASEFLQTPKVYLRETPDIQFQAKVEGSTIDIRFNYRVKMRNKILERAPIIVRDSPANLQSPQTVTIR